MNQFTKQELLIIGSAPIMFELLKRVIASDKTVILEIQQLIQKIESESNEK